MKILLDTHILIWLHTNDSQLSEKARKIILDPSNIIYYSSINIWEIQMKNLKAPDIFPYSGDAIQELSVQANIRCVPVLPAHALALKTLSYAENAPSHKDPFDKMLICQAKVENMLLMTHDSLIPNYNESCILVV